MLVDSNIILYAWLPEHVWLRRFIESEGPVVSAISYVETLGYPKLRNEEKIFFVPTDLVRRSGFGHHGIPES